MEVTDEAFEKIEPIATNVFNIHDQNGGNAGHTVHVISVEKMLPIINELVEPHKKLTHRKRNV